jgi:hypothetical protein
LLYIICVGSAYFFNFFLLHPHHPCATVLIGCTIKYREDDDTAVNRYTGIAMHVEASSHALQGRRRRGRSKSEFTIPERALAASLQGRLRANNRRGAGKARHTGARERNLSITTIRNQSSMV